MIASRPTSGSSKGGSCERTMATAAAPADQNCQSRQIGADDAGTSPPMAANVEGSVARSVGCSDCWA